MLATLGLLPTDHPTGTGEFAAADATGLTDVPGVWVAGNVTDLAAGVVTAAAGAPAAGAAINADLIAEDTRKAIVAKFPRYPCLWPCLGRSRAGQRGSVMNRVRRAPLSTQTIGRSSSPQHRNVRRRTLKVGQ